MFSKLLHWLFTISVRSFFVATSLSPVFLVLAIGDLERYCKYKGTKNEIELYCFMIYFVISIVLWISCWFMLWMICKKDTTPIPIDNLNRKDNEILSFLFIFILPLVKGSDSLLGNEPVTTFICFLILIFAIADIGAYHFNPIIRLWGYHIYSIKVGNRDSMLIAKSRRMLRSRPEGKLKVVNIANGVYIHHSKIMSK